MTKRKRRSFTPEFKADAVRLVKAGDRAIGLVAKDLDLTETALRDWVKRDVVDTSTTPQAVLTTAERATVSPREHRGVSSTTRRLTRERAMQPASARSTRSPRRRRAGRGATASGATRGEQTRRRRAPHRGVSVRSCARARRSRPR